MHMVRDRVIADIVAPGLAGIISEVNMVGSAVHRHRGEGLREGADKQATSSSLPKFRNPLMPRVCSVPIAAASLAD